MRRPLAIVVDRINLISQRGVGVHGLITFPIVYCWSFHGIMRSWPCFGFVVVIWQFGRVTKNWSQKMVKFWLQRRLVEVSFLFISNQLRWLFFRLFIGSKACFEMFSYNLKMEKMWWEKELLVCRVCKTIEMKSLLLFKIYFFVWVLKERKFLKGPKSLTRKTSW